MSERVCEALYCFKTESDTSAISTTSPPMNGTICGSGKVIILFKKIVKSNCLIILKSFARLENVLKMKKCLWMTASMERIF